MTNSRLVSYIDKYAARNSYALLILFILGVISYGNTINNPFVHDDVAFIVKNPFINQLHLPALFDIFFNPTKTSGIINMYYRPLLEVFYRLEYRLFGLNAAPYHFVNILIHVFNSFLVYHFVKLIWPKINSIPLSIAILFIIHPLQTESVTYLSGISDLVFTFFCLASLNCYLIYRNKEIEKNLLWLYILSLFFFILALAAKEHSIIVPFLIIVYEMCFYEPALEKKRKKRLIVNILGYIFVLGGYFLLRKIIGGATFTLGTPLELDLRIASIPKIILNYVGLVFFPYQLHFYRSHNILEPFILPLMVFLLLLCFLLILVKTMHKYHRCIVLFGLGFLAVSLLPTINLIPLSLEYSYIFTAEHFMYFPIVGLLLSFFGMGYYFTQKYHLNINLNILFAGITICLVSVTMRQNTYYKNEIALFKRSVEFEPHLSRVHFLLAKAYQAKEEYHLAISENTKAIKILQNYLKWTKDINVRQHYEQLLGSNYFDLAVSFYNLGGIDDSIRYFEKVIQIDSRDNKALNYLGILYIRKGGATKAIAVLQKAIEINQTDLFAKNNLAIAYADANQKDKARKLWQEILEKDPRFVLAQQNLKHLLSGK